MMWPRGGKSFVGRPGHIQSVGMSRFYNGSYATVRVETMVVVAARATTTRVH